MPYGRLREPASAINRADMVIVTKCPANMTPMEYRMFKENLSLFPYQKLFFSRYVYGHLVPVFAENCNHVPYLDWLTDSDAVLIVTGIANPRPFVRHIRRYKAKVRLIRFGDHVNFNHADMEAIKRKFDAMNGKKRFVLTTEKDAVKLAHNPYFPHALKAVTFYMPVSVDFVSQQPEEPTFDASLQKLISGCSH